MSGNFRSGRRPDPKPRIKKRRLIEKTAKGKPIKPTELTDEEEWCWDNMIAPLEHLGVADTATAVMACEIWGRYRDSLYKHIKRPQDAGSRVATVQFARTWYSIMVELGGSPFSRKRMLQEEQIEEEESPRQRAPLLSLGS